MILVLNWQYWIETPLFNTKQSNKTKKVKIQCNTIETSLFPSPALFYGPSDTNLWIFVKTTACWMRFSPLFRENCLFILYLTFSHGVIHRPGPQYYSRMLKLNTNILLRFELLFFSGSSIIKYVHLYFNSNLRTVASLPATPELMTEFKKSAQDFALKANKLLPKCRLLTLYLKWTMNMAGILKNKLVILKILILKLIDTHQQCRKKPSVVLGSCLCEILKLVHKILKTVCEI